MNKKINKLFSIVFLTSIVVQILTPAIYNASEIASKILILLLENKNEILTREEIFQQVWDSSYTYSTRVIDTHRSYIRKQTNDVRIRSVRGKGYIFES